MSNLIQLESEFCPSCKKSLDKWTLKVAVSEMTLGVRCQSCGHFIRLTMKGGEAPDAGELRDALDAAESRSKAEEQMARDDRSKSDVPNNLKEE